MFSLFSKENFKTNIYGQIENKKLFGDTQIEYLPIDFVLR